MYTQQAAEKKQVATQRIVNPKGELNLTFSSSPPRRPTLLAPADSRFCGDFLFWSWGSIGDISINIDATTLSAPKGAFFGPRGPQSDSILTRINFVQATSLGVGHSFQVRNRSLSLFRLRADYRRTDESFFPIPTRTQAALSPATTLTVAGRMKTMRGRGGAKLGGSFLGTISHTWSPNLYLEVSNSLFCHALVEEEVSSD